MKPTVQDYRQAKAKVELVSEKLADLARQDKHPRIFYDELVQDLEDLQGARATISAFIEGETAEGLTSPASRISSLSEPSASPLYHNGEPVTYE